MKKIIIAHKVSPEYSAINGDCCELNFLKVGPDNTTTIIIVK